jgi:hypothetical protein
MDIYCKDQRLCANGHLRFKASATERASAFAKKTVDKLAEMAH